MASSNTNSADGHFSFAKIAAMPAPSMSQPSMVSGESGAANTANSTQSTVDHDYESVELAERRPSPDGERHSSSDRTCHGLTAAMQGINLDPRNSSQGCTLSNGVSVNGILKRENSFDDDRTHLSTSSTKMTNFDTKSLASVTTFAMDEKDSVRPDDSASVQAVDEDESLSGVASGAPNSVTGSEAGVRLFRDHFRDNVGIRSREMAPGYGEGNPQDANVMSPDSVASNFANPINLETSTSAHVVHPFPLHPDEKLATAMESPKDRLVVLTIEEKVRAFIKYSSEQSLELPPNNSYGRLLAHRLGDYYHLTHFVDNNVTSVRLHRTPFSRLPTPLSELYPVSNEKPVHPMPTKIMRRTDGRPSAEGSIAASSSVASKAASEAGSTDQDGDRTGSAGSMSAKDRMAMTREEREAKYAEVRERIFRDFPESAKSETSGDSTSMSRSSSTTGRKKAAKQRTPLDDGFEARSQFNVYYPGNPYGNNMSGYNSSVSDGSYSNNVPYMVGPGVAPPNGGYTPTNQNMMYSGQMSANGLSQYPARMTPQMNGVQSWQGTGTPQQSPYQGYSSMNQTSTGLQQAAIKSPQTTGNYMTPNSPQFAQNTNWANPTYMGHPPQHAVHQRTPQTPSWPNYPAQNANSATVTPHVATYSYAQYPGQHLNSSFNNSGAPHARSHFNPQTRSFVPGDTGAQRHPVKGVSSRMQAYGNRAPPVAQPNWSRFPDPAPNQSFESFSNANPPRNSSPASQTSIARWGTPSHLPPKPPPSEVSSDFDIKNRSGSVNIAGATANSNGISGVVNNGPFVVSGGSTAKMH
ncbi:hypothetical protein N7539_004548 [Penicillium diatomitis]|uniref:R3H domain protein n=1 Tax=Penicillium diatomitis TaxID=2819901 RepID=A0A9X0BYS0_9EURO|nr:uncharacterized protein N7539_004548 [Penicillium diatomitis]KAJ5489658.1 hypothetical protein N7539_004548 [Penicillium diatomitis]